MYHYCPVVEEEKLTDESLLAEVFGFLEVMFPLEQSQRLVDQRQHVDAHGLDLLLHIHRLVELLNGLVEVLLVEQEFTVVVVHIRHLFKVLHRTAERGHSRGNRAHLVLRHSQLDVRVDKGAVEVDRLLVVLGRFGVLPEDEVQLGPVVVDIRVVLVLIDGQFKVIRSGILVSYILLLSYQNPVSRPGERTKFKVQAGTLDVALHQRRLQLDTLVKVSQSRLGVTLEIGKGGSHVQRESFKVIEFPNLQRLLKGRGRLVVPITRLLANGNQTPAQQALARLLRQIIRLLEPLGERSRPEALQVVGDKGGAGELLALGLEDGLALALGNLLQQPFERVTADLVREAVHDTAGGEIEQGLAKLLEVFVGDGSSVQGLDVLVVHGQRGGGIVHNLIPIREHIVTGGPVGVVNGVGLADDSLSVQLNGPVVVLGAVGLVTGNLEFFCVVMSGLLCIKWISLLPHERMIANTEHFRTHLTRQLPNGSLIHLWDFFRGLFSLLGFICKSTGQFRFFSSSFSP